VKLLNKQSDQVRFSLTQSDVSEITEQSGASEITD